MKQFVITIHPQRFIPAEWHLPAACSERQRRGNGTVRKELKIEN